MTKKIPGAVRGRPRSFDRTGAVGAALRLFWNRGFEGTSITDLTGALDIVAPSLYAAFASKEGLYREAIDLYGRKYSLKLKRAIDEEPTAERAVRRILLEAARVFTRRGLPHGCFIASGMLASAPEYQPLAAVFRSKRAAMIDALDARIQQDVQKGGLPKRTDARAIAEFFGTVIEGMSVQARDGASERSLRATAELAMKVWRIP